MRVLALCEYPTLNGGEHSLLAALPTALSHDVDLAVAAPRRGPLAQALAQRHIRHVPDCLHDADGVRLPRAAARERLAAWIAANQPSVVHANSLSMSRLCGPVAAECGVPSLGHLRDILRLSKTALADLQQNQRLLAVSAATRQWYLELGVRERLVEVAYNGVDVARFSPQSTTGTVHRELGLGADVPLVGMVGQFGMRKGVDVYVDAARRLAADFPNAHFLFAGQRCSGKQEAIDYEAGVRTAAEQGPLARRFHFLGVRQDIPEILNELSIYVHAARQEPLGRVLLEAAASAKPIVATNVGGTPEIFPADTAAARLVAPDSASDLGGAIADLLNDAPLRAAMGKRARLRILEKFDARQRGHQLAAHYRELAESRR